MTDEHKADVPSADSQQVQKPTEGTTPESVDNSWTNRMAGLWTTASDRLQKLLPTEQVTQTVIDWFSVNEAQVAEILASVRKELPTTQALLMDKRKAREGRRREKTSACCVHSPRVSASFSRTRNLHMAAGSVMYLWMPVFTGMTRSLRIK